MKQLKFNKQISASLIIALALSFGFSACSKKKDSGLEPEPEMKTVVHLVGHEYDGTKTVAKYWKDGIETSLTTEGNNGAAAAIAVSGTDVYIVGYEEVGGKRVATYWKNGILPTRLTDETSSAEAKAIAVVGNDVYIAGHERIGRYFVATYWKNGIPTRLPGASETSDGSAEAIAVGGVKVYVAGVDIGKKKAMLWENGTAKSLSDGYASAVSVAGGKVYVVETENNVTTLWEDGIAKEPMTNVSANAMVVVGDNLYVAGTDYSGTKSVAAYWKNGKKIPLSDGVNDAYANAIAIDGDDIYIAGFEGDRTKSVARLWKNGVSVTLPTPTSSASSYASGIAITKETVVK